MTTSATPATVLDCTQTVNETLRRFPATVTVFKAYGIDSCCGGALPVSEAAQRHGVDPDDLWSELLHAINQ